MPSRLWVGALETLGRHKYGEIPESDWAGPIRRLSPIRIYLDSLNVVIVLSETADHETGKYIVSGLSSNMLSQCHNGYTFTPDPQVPQGRRGTEEIYDYSKDRD